MHTTSIGDDFGSQEDLALCEQEGLVAPGWELDIPAALTAFTPANGGPGTRVVLTGTYLTAASAVTLAGNPVASFTVDSPTQITALVPSSGASGPLRVVTPAGAAVSATNFTFTGTTASAPTLTAFTPTFGSTRDTVTLTGTNFTGATAVRFGKRDADDFTVVSPTQITAHPPGVFNLWQNNTATAGGAGGGSATQSSVASHAPFTDKISVVTPAGTATSAADFSVVIPPYDPPGGGEDQ